MMHRRLVSGTWEGDTVRRIQDPDRASGPPEKTRVPVTLLYHSHILALHAYIIVLMGPNVIQRPPEETIMNRRIATVVALVVVAVALAGVVGTTAYRAGLARGLADAGSVPGPWLYHGPFWYPGPFAFLFPLLGVFVILAVGADGRSLENAEIGSPPTTSENVPSPMATSGGGTACWDWRTS